MLHRLQPADGFLEFHILVVAGLLVPKVEERLVLPMAEIGAPLQEGVGRLMREVVGKLMPLVMNEEVHLDGSADGWPNVPRQQGLGRVHLSSLHFGRIVGQPDTIQVHTRGRLPDSP